MLYLNNRSLSQDNIVSDFKNKVVDAGPPKNPKAPSALRIFQRKLQSIYFGVTDPLEALENESRFDAYPGLKAMLYKIFNLKDGDDLSQAFSQLKQVEPEWAAPDLDKHWQRLDSEYGYFTGFNDRALKDLYRQLVQSTRKMAVLFEENNNPEDTVAYENAYKLMALFVDSDKPIKLNEQFNEVSKRTYKLFHQSDVQFEKPFHDVLLVKLALPFATSFQDKSGWRNLIDSIGMQAFPFFAMADKMEAKAAEADGQPLAPQNRREAERIFVKLKYARGDEDPEFAALCHASKVDEKTFNKCLDYMREIPGWPKKNEDNLPDIEVHGEGDAAGYRIVKLPINDKRALILGKITDCCQSIDGHSELCVKDGVSLTDNGFYVILKEDKKGNTKIIGQSYAWRSKSGSLCLDSVECLKDSISNDALKALLTGFSQQILSDDPDMKMITIGRGGKTPKDVFADAFSPEVMSQGMLYGDALSQYLIMGQAQMKSGPLPEGLGLEDNLKSFFEWVRNFLPNDADLESEIATFLSGNMSPTLKNAVIAGAQTVRNYIAILPFLETRVSPENMKDMELRISDLVLNVQDFKTVRDVLQPEQFQAFYTVIKGKLVDIIECESDIKEIFMCLSPEQCKEVVNLLKMKLPDIFKDGRRFLEVLFPLHGNKSRVLVDAMKEHLPKIINTASVFESMMLTYLKPGDQAEFITAMTSRFSEMIKNGNDFRTVFRNITPQQRTRIYEAIKEDMPDILSSYSDINMAFQYLSLEQCEEVIKSIKDKLPHLFRGVKSFYNGFYGLDEDKCRLLIEAMKADLPEIIQDTHDFEIALRFLTPNDRTVIYEAMKDRLHAYIKTAAGLNRVLKYLTPDQCKYVCKNVSISFSDMINKHDELAAVLKPLAPEMCGEVIHSIKEKLPNVINSGFELGMLLMGLDIEQCEAVLQAMEDKLPDIINNANDFYKTLEYLLPKTRTALYEVMKETIPTRILEESRPSHEAMIDALRYTLLQTMLMTFEAVTHFFDDMGPMLQETKSSYYLDGIDQSKLGYAFKKYTMLLEPEEAIEVYEALQEHLPKGFDLDAHLIRDYSFNEMKKVLNDLKEGGKDSDTQYDTEQYLSR